MDESDAATSHPTFVKYIERSRDFYAAKGYEKQYRWARFSEVPFAKLDKPLSECRVTLVTTARPIVELVQVNGVSRAGKQVWSGSTEEPPDSLYTDHVAWDKEATHTDDVESFLPIGHLRAFAESGRIGSVAKRYHGVPTEFSQRRTLEQDAPKILSRCREDNVDVALLIPL